MKNSIITIVFILVSFCSYSNEIVREDWNNTGKELTFKKGDVVKVKEGSKSLIM